MKKGVGATSWTKTLGAGALSTLDRKIGHNR